MLREVWRVLNAGGRLLVVVPNRRGLWARMDTTPFGHGRPYSRSQITHLLRETWFTPTSWGEALYVPPISRGWFLRAAVAWERTGATIYYVELFPKRAAQTAGREPVLSLVPMPGDVQEVTDFDLGVLRLQSTAP